MVWNCFGEIESHLKSGLNGQLSIMDCLSTRSAEQLPLQELEKHLEMILLFHLEDPVGAGMLPGTLSVAKCNSLEH